MQLKSNGEMPVTLSSFLRFFSQWRRMERVETNRTPLVIVCMNCYAINCITLSRLIAVMFRQCFLLPQCSTLTGRLCTHFRYFVFELVSDWCQQYVDHVYSIKYSNIYLYVILFLFWQWYMNLTQVRQNQCSPFRLFCERPFSITFLVTFSQLWRCQSVINFCHLVFFVFDLFKC